MKRLGFVLDHAEDAQAAAAIRLLLFTGARSSEITRLRRDWISETSLGIRLYRQAVSQAGASWAQQLYDSVCCLVAA